MVEIIAFPSPPVRLPASTSLALRSARMRKGKNQKGRGMAPLCGITLGLEGSNCGLHIVERFNIHVEAAHFKSRSGFRGKF